MKCSRAAPTKRSSLNQLGALITGLGAAVAAAPPKIGAWAGISRCIGACPAIAGCPWFCWRRRAAMKRKAMKATRAINRISSIWMPSKPSPMNMEASRPPAAIPASGPSQREAPLAAAAGRAALGAAAVAFGAVAGCAWRVWWLGAEPRLLPPPKRLALASRLTVSARQKARAMLRTRCIVVFLSWGNRRASCCGGTGGRTSRILFRAIAPRPPFFRPPRLARGSAPGYTVVDEDDRRYPGSADERPPGGWKGAAQSLAERSVTVFFSTPIKHLPVLVCGSARLPGRAFADPFPLERGPPPCMPSISSRTSP